eukprot:7385827-Prymnesium_polylepis.1
MLLTHCLDSGAWQRQATGPGGSIRGRRRSDLHRVRVREHHCVRVGRRKADAHDRVVAWCERVAHLLRLDVAREELGAKIFTFAGASVLEQPAVTSEVGLAERVISAKGVGVARVGRRGHRVHVARRRLAQRLAAQLRHAWDAVDSHGALDRMCRQRVGDRVHVLASHQEAASGVAGPRGRGGGRHPRAACGRVLQLLDCAVQDAAQDGLRFANLLDLFLHTYQSVLRSCDHLLLVCALRRIVEAPIRKPLTASAALTIKIALDRRIRAFDVIVWRRRRRRGLRYRTEAMRGLPHRV